MNATSLGLGLALLLSTPVVAQTPPAASAPTAAPAPAPAPAPARPSMVDKLINSPFVQNWNLWGLSPAPMPQAAEGVTGGKSLTIAVPRAGDPWSVGAVMTVPGAIKAGDVLLLGVWVRVVQPPEGQTQATVPIILLEGQNEGKVAIAQATNIAVNPTWTMIYASGVATTDFAAGQSSIFIQMGQAQQTLELGPALLFDFGADYDRSRLPRNSEP